MVVEALSGEAVADLSGGAVKAPVNDNDPRLAVESLSRSRILATESRDDPKAVTKELETGPREVNHQPTEDNRFSNVPHECAKPNENNTILKGSRGGICLC